MQRLFRLDPGEPGVRPRSALALIAGSAIVLAANLTAILGAGALPQPAMTVAVDAESVATHGPLAVNNPTTGEVHPIPTDCGDPTSPLDAPVFTASCDVIPIDVIVPDVTEADDFFLELFVTWNPTDQNEDVGVAVNDLDTYLYDNQQMAKREDPESTLYTMVGSSAGATQPESIKIFRPELGRYNLIVTNWSGVNVDYTVRARVIVGLFETPFEALAPTFSNGGSADEEFAAPVDNSASPTGPRDFSDDAGGAAFGSGSSPFAGTIGVAASAPPMGDVAVLPDDDFAGFETESEFEESLAARPTMAAPAAALRLAPPKPVAAAVLLFWLLLVPLVLAGAGWFLIMRRRTNLAFA